MAKEAFITALNSHRLQIEVMKKEPRNIEEALNYAIKLEAFEQSLMVSNGDNSASTDDSRVQKRQKYVYTVADPPPVSETAVLQKQVTELQQVLAQATKGMAAVANGPWKAPVQVSAAMPTVSAA